MTMTGNAKGVISCAFSPDGKQIVSVSGSSDNTLKLWDAKRGKEIAEYLCYGYVPSCSMSGCGRFIACGDSIGNVFMLKFEGSGFLL
jgi:WD40 repeat protein